MISKVNSLIIFFVLISLSIKSQVGIATSDPNSMLDVRGSLQTAYREISTATSTLGINDHHISYTGATAGTITLPSIASGTASYNGRMYFIKNLSSQNVTIVASGGNKLRADNLALDNIILQPGFYAEIVNNTNTISTSATWDISFVVLPIPQNVELYDVNFKIPPYATTVTNHNTTAYDTTSGVYQWWLISTSSQLAARTTTLIRPNRMTLVYEYQGPLFDLTGIHPILLINTTGTTVNFIASFGGLSVVGGKVRFTFTVARYDYIDNGTTASQWTNTFDAVSIFTRKLY